MYDLLIKNARIIDGTGASAHFGSVAVSGRRIVGIGDVTGPARRVVDADGLVVGPGFIDVHTHIDAQAFWDPTLSPSPLHGVTTMIAGNCGFTIAPLTREAADYLRRMLAKVEGMPLESLEVGVPWDWATTGEFLDRQEGRLSINAGFMVGHSTLRRVVMGDAATERPATQAETVAMCGLLSDGLAAGGLGFSSTWSESHNDAEGRPVPSRHATAAELIALAQVCSGFPGTSLEFLPRAVGEFSPDVVELMTDMSRAARRPLNWNILSVTADTVATAVQRLEASDHARTRGAKVVALHMPVRSAPVRLSFRSGFILDMLPGWAEPMALSLNDKMRLLSDPVARRRLDALAQQSSGVNRDRANWSASIIMETFRPELKFHEGRRVGEIATETGKQPFDVLVEIALLDELRTTFAQPATPDTRSDWDARRKVWTDDRVVLGASDAGAHLDMLGTFCYTTRFLGEAVREQGLLSLELAVSLLTSRPAHLYGLRRRGTLRDGDFADLVLFDPDTVGAEGLSTRADLPGGASRLYCEATGVHGVFVNGAEIVHQGQFTDARSGSVVRSGRDTDTPSLAY